MLPMVRQNHLLAVALPPLPVPVGTVPLVNDFMMKFLSLANPSIPESIEQWFSVKTEKKFVDSSSGCSLRRRLFDRTNLCTSISWLLHVLAQSILAHAFCELKIVFNVNSIPKIYRKHRWHTDNHHQSRTREQVKNECRTESTVSNLKLQIDSH